MKCYIQSPDASGNIDPTVMNNLLAHLHVTANLAHADVIVVPVCWGPSYSFSRQLPRGRKYVLIDFTEYGWDAGETNNVLGTGCLHQFEHLKGADWLRLDEWVRDNPPILHFKRELLARDASPRLKPIDFPCYLPPTPIQSREAFDARPLEVFSCWGLSHPARQRLHGDIFAGAHDHGIHVIDSWEQAGRYEGRNWATIHSPHYARKHIATVMEWQRQAKVSVSLPGAGVKCFRSAEAPVDAIMALQQDKVLWSFPWTHRDNCIRLTPGAEFASLIGSIGLLPLYDIYRAGQETIDRYRSDRYANEYVLPLIEEAL